MGIFHVRVFWSVLVFLSIVALMWKDEDWRRRLGETEVSRLSDSE